VSGQPVPGQPQYGQPAPGQPPYGQFGPAGQGQFGPGQPPQGQFGPAGPGAYPPPGAYQPPVRKKSSAPRIVILSIVGVLLIVGVIVGVISSRSSPDRAKVGDCLKGSSITSTTAQDASDVKIVACTSSDAKYKVVGKLDNKSKTEFEVSQNPCTDFKDATSALWGQTKGENGYILCLADN
jgi:hypothetical protein